MSKYTRYPYTSFEAGEIANAMHELLGTNVPNPSYAEANREVLQHLGHLGVIKRYGGTKAAQYAQKGIDGHRRWEEGKGGSAHYLIADEQRKIIGAASIQLCQSREQNLNNVQLYEVTRRVPPLIAQLLDWRRPVQAGTHLVSAWTHIIDAGHEAEVEIYEQLVDEVRASDPAACAWTTLPEHYIDIIPAAERRKLARSLGSIATARYDVLESKLAVPQRQDLLVDPERSKLITAQAE